MANLLRKGHKNIYNSWVVCLSAFQALFMPCGSFIALHRKTYFFHKYLQFPWGQCFPKVPSFSKCPQIDFAQMRQLVLLKLSHLLSITNLSTQLSTYYCKWVILSFFVIEDTCLSKTRLEDFLLQSHFHETNQSISYLYILQKDVNTNI